MENHFLNNMIDRKYLLEIFDRYVIFSAADDSKKQVLCTT